MSVTPFDIGDTSERTRCLNARIFGECFLEEGDFLNGFVRGSAQVGFFDESAYEFVDGGILRQFFERAREVMSMSPFEQDSFIQIDQGCEVGAIFAEDEDVFDDWILAQEFAGWRNAGGFIAFEVYEMLTVCTESASFVFENEIIHTDELLRHFWGTNRENP